MNHWTTVLLSGGPRDHGIGATLQLPLDDFPVHDSLTSAEAWLKVIRERDQDGSSMPAPRHCLRLVGRTDPRLGMETPRDFWTETAELRSHRGVAGAIADVVGHYGPDEIGDWILVLESSACPAVDIHAMLESVKDADDAAVILGISDLERISGCYLVRREIYELVPENGFFDFKEQLLSRAIQTGHKVSVIRVAARARRMYSRQGCLACVEAWAGRRSALGDATASTSNGPWRKREGPSVVRPTAVVDDAVILSSVVMDGAVVEPGAVIARSIVGPGARVPAGTFIVDAVHTQASARRLMKNRRLMRGTENPLRDQDP